VFGLLERLTRGRQRRRSAFFNALARGVEVDVRVQQRQT
jgi:hypothetical protein